MIVPILDLIAGMIFLYFLLAIVNNSCLELFATVIQWRARLLVGWVRQVCGNAASDILKDAASGFANGKKLPAYLHAKDFASAVVLHLQAENPAVAVWDAAQLREAVGKSAFSESAKKVLVTFVADTPRENERADNFVLTHFGQQVEHWFHRSMRHLTDAYKRSTMYFTFLFAMAITLALNIDSLQLASYLYSHPQQSEALAAASDHAIENKNVNAIDTLHDATHTQMIAYATDAVPHNINTQLPMGWPDVQTVTTKNKMPLWYWMKKVGGLFITVMAICLGAPFWFEVLGKVANLRSSLKPIESLKQNA